MDDGTQFDAVGMGFEDRDPLAPAGTDAAHLDAVAVPGDGRTAECLIRTVECVEGGEEAEPEPEPAAT
jgi:hypothetical protein